MNHHVRNALQVISDSVHLRGHTQQIKDIHVAIKRIDWALREILPGEGVDANRFAFPDQDQQEPRADA